MGTTRRLAAGPAAAAMIGAAALAGVAGPASGQQATRTQVEEIVTVTTTRLPLGRDDLTSGTRALAGSDLTLQGARGLDEALRQLPQFALFRRAPARAAHPTTHGVNLRGVAPTGTSRALVLVDGVPLTDGFGGWVQWDRIPLVAVERVEASFGGGPAPFGNQSLSGTLQVVTRDPRAAPGRAWLRGLAGSQATWETSAAAATAGLLLAGRAFATDGYVAIEPRSRGPVDTRKGSRGYGGYGRFAGPAGIRATADLFRADRDNGTPLQTNEVGGFGGSVAWTAPTSSRSGVGASAFARSNDLDSIFSSIAEDRASELAVLDQQVRSSDVGVNVTGWTGLGERTTIGWGAEWRRASGTSRERVLTAGFTREPGGTQNLGGVYVAARAHAAGRLILETSLRGDLWRETSRTDLDPTHTGSVASPRLGLAWQPAAGWVVRASGYGSFRAPTLNELYRQFRVGDVVTAANPELDSERLWGFDGGLSWEGGAGAARLRVEASAYWNRLNRAVVNATVAARDGLVFRQRRNLGAARVAGLEGLVRARWSRLEATVAGAWMSARIVAGPAEDAGSVAGNRLPQVPPWRLTGTLRYTAPRGWSATLTGLASGRQFEDDLNSLALAGGGSLDAIVEWPLGRGIALGIEAQNLLGPRIEVARNPQLELGPPRSVAATLRLTPGDGPRGSVR